MGMCPGTTGVTTMFPSSHILRALADEDRLGSYYFLMTVTSAPVIIFLLLNVFTHVNSSHFEGGTITYKIYSFNSSYAQVLITQTYIYSSAITCTNAMIASQSPIVDLSTRGDFNISLICVANCTTSGGYTPILHTGYCTDLSAALAISVTQRSDLETLSIGSYFQVAFQQSSWRSLTNGGSFWSVACTISLILRPDGLTLNTPPVATLISPIAIPVGVVQYIQIPTIDADNDDVRCRFATGAQECADVCPPASLPSGTTISTDCTLTITGAQANDWYAVALQIEDFWDTTTNTAFSNVPLQFLIHVYATPSPCLIRPYLYGNFTAGECVGVQVGQPFTMTLFSINYCQSSGYNILDIATLSFPIVTKTTIAPLNSTVSYVTLTWVPAALQVGSQVMCSVAVDDQSQQSNQYCVTFTVGASSVPSCPGETIATTTTTSTSTTSTSTSTTSVTTVTVL
ncbi:unnamed protein product, partial [Didymodactylos carnosus]